MDFQLDLDQLRAWAVGVIGSDLGAEENVKEAAQAEVEAFLSDVAPVLVGSTREYAMALRDVLMEGSNLRQFEGSIRTLTPEELTQLNEADAEENERMVRAFIAQRRAVIERAQQTLSRLAKMALSAALAAALGMS